VQSGLTSTLRAAMRQNVACVCALMMLRDWQAGRRQARGDISADTGQRHADLNVEESIAYIERIYRDYLSYGQTDRLLGQIAEIGPGDNFGVALLALANGARKVIALDRFYSRRDEDAQRRIYAELARRHDLSGQFDGEPAERNLRNVEYRAGQPAEEFFRSSGLRFDHIISRAVLEHLYDPISALDDMANTLEPGGSLIHRIDLRDHGMFAGLHPLTFLTVPDAIYRRMVQNTGKPNRVLIDTYRRWLERSGLQGDIRITRLAGRKDELEPRPWQDLPADARADALKAVADIKHRMIGRYRALPDEDLAVSGIVLYAHKA
jgi:SAM-dependent methyltransferase